jgi:N-acyl homoserine lactone hydrolase
VVNRTGLAIITTPGHTSGHQSVVVSTGDGATEVLIGDAAYTSTLYSGPANQKLPPGQPADMGSWQESIGSLHEMEPARVRFCHDTAVVHS